MSDQSGSSPRFSRRKLMGLAGAAGGGLVLGAGAYAARSDGDENDAPDGDGPIHTEPFHGAHQAGITTAQQKYVRFLAFDVTVDDPSALRSLLRTWTHTAAALSAGRAEELLNPARLTVSFGLGPSIFDRRFGLSGDRPAPLVDIPPFPHDQLDPARCNGDLAVQVCSDDKHTAFTAMRALIAAADGVAGPRWGRDGFVRDALPGEEGGTPRNLLGFKDGTGNLKAKNEGRMRRNVWVNTGDAPDWMTNGSYLVVREIELDVDGFLLHEVEEQEITVGRHRVSGAPLGQTDEFDPVIRSEQPKDTHIMVANQRLPGSEDERILRRSYNYADGFDTFVNAQTGGLLFMAYQRDPRRQFVPIQTRLAKGDRLQHHLYPKGSAIFAMPPGAAEGSYVGETLLG